MDASASPRVNAKFDDLFGLFVKIENSPFPLNSIQKKTVIKYTRLPDFDLDKASWPQDSYTIDPRFRRIVTVEEPKESTTRSLKSEVALPPKNMNSQIISSRKIVTIKEDDENDLHPKFSRTRGKYTKPVNRSTSSQLMEEKQVSQRSTTRLSNSSKTSKDTKLSAKNSVANSKKDLSPSKLSSRSKTAKFDNQASNTYTNKSYRGEGMLQNTQSANASTKITLSKKLYTPSHSEREIYRNKPKVNNDRRNAQTKISTDSKQSRSRLPSCKDIKGRSVTVIHVPLDNQFQERDVPKIQYTSLVTKENKPITVARGSEVDRSIFSKDILVGTEPAPHTTDRGTDIDNDHVSCNTLENSFKNRKTKEIFDSLDIPNVSLTKDKNDLPKEEIVNFFSKSLPNIIVPPLNFSIAKKQDEQIEESLFCKSTSYIISRATLTYTSKQKIDFQVVESSKNNLQPHLTANSINYPMNIVSVYKKELEQREYSDSTGLKPQKEQNSKTCKSRKSRVKHRNDVMSLNCSVVLDGNKFTKPSDIISTIKLNNGSFHNSLMCEQFQRELNFIDSFFESLQYLETCSLSEKCLTENKVDNWIGSSYNYNNYEYGTLLSKLENGIDVEDKETMVSESLCLLNLLIRDEQRRAKKLLFVLKMREDALKDFTKSQILWLENKKKQDNTDIPTLKKKQRGALLKLQHECGEMQRMRKALLTLSEKRKTALIKTKKNIEWKLENNVDVEQIMLGKRKMKRNMIADRNISPLKCFDLSSSGCDESISSRSKCDALVLLDNEASRASVTSAEKWVQTGDSLSASTLIDNSTSTAAENFVVVDGGYLNILFQNILLPQIFSSGKQYEVNEEALKNIITTSNQRHANVDESQVLEKLINQIKDHDVERTSAPSTARSLVEEFDQYYKGLNEDSTSPTVLSESDTVDEINDLPTRLMPLGEAETSECSTQVSKTDIDDTLSKSTSHVPSVDQACACEPAVISVETQSLSSTDPDTCVSGPLPIPAGAAAVVEALSPSTWLPEKSSSTSSIGSSSSISSNPIGSNTIILNAPVHNEAEELRRQQLAIEREIKALEQQQSQLLVVREIPDKPPPPYTPPVELRPRPPRVFAVAETTTDKIRKYVLDPVNAPDSDPFDIFVKDFCQETLQRQRSEQSERFWDTCNIVPPKPPLDTEKLVNRTASELQEVLTSAAPAVVSGVGARRSDHIDDILFAEWRRCEPEWTSLHADEAIVKNQIFESIFQKILTETIDEYKKTVLTE